MKHILPPALTLIFWITSVFWLIRHEVCPEFFTHSVAGYEDVIRGEDLMRDSWVKILYNGSHIGYSHSTTELSESDPSRYYAMMNSSMIKIKVMKKLHKVTVNSSVFLDMAYNLTEFVFSLNSELYSARVIGRQNPDGLFDVQVRHADNFTSRRIKLPGNALVQNPFPTARIRNMKPGEHLNALVLNPFTMENETVTLQAVKNGEITIEGTNCNATLLAMKRGDIEIHNWIDSDGNILRQDMPFGLSLERSSAEKSSIPDEAIKVDESFVRLVLMPALGGR